MKNFLDKASSLYYAGTPMLSDDEFDSLASRYNYSNVGHTVTDGVPHLYPMYSLQKCFDIEDSPLNVNDCVCTPKLDGAAVSLLYVNGRLELALTRGDGKVGRDITDKMELLVPNVINGGHFTQITGEVVAPSSIPNSRNYASGSLNLKDLSIFSSRNLTFVAYDVYPSTLETYTSTMGALSHLGMSVVTHFDSSPFPTDGAVYRIDDNTKFLELGHTAHHPRGAFALKEQKKGVVTKLLDVTWQVGKSGVVSPVAILEPVTIGEAEVARATLHNIDYIRELELEIGCNVEVIRSGEIIPRIVRRV